MQARRSKVRPTGEGGRKRIWRDGEKRKTKSLAAEGSSGCYSGPSTDIHTLAASQGPTFVLRGRHWQACSLILRDSARSVLDSALRDRRSTQRVNPSPAASQSQGDLGPRSSSGLAPPSAPPTSGGREPVGTSRWALGISSSCSWSFSCSTSLKPRRREADTLTIPPFHR